MQRGKNAAIVIVRYAHHTSGDLDNNIEVAKAEMTSEITCIMQERDKL